MYIVRVCKNRNYKGFLYLRGWDKDGVYYRTAKEYNNLKSVREFANLAQVKYAISVLQKKEKDIVKIEVVSV